MANIAAAKRAIAQATWPGAIVTERTKSGLKHQHPTDPLRFMVDSQAGAWHVGDGPYTEADEISTAWVSSGDPAFDLEIENADFVTKARTLFNAGNIFRFEQAGEFVLFDPQSLNWIDENTSRQQIAIKQAVNGSASDNQLDFIGAYGTGIDFRYENQSIRLKKYITIDQFSRIDTTLPGGNEIWLEVEFSIAFSSGVKAWLDTGSGYVQWAQQNNVRVQTTNRIEFRDEATGTQVFWHLDFPRAWDSAGNETIGQMEVRRQGGPSNLFIMVRIPKTWVDSATFPIFIDPTIDSDVATSADDGHSRGSGQFDNSGGQMHCGERSVGAFRPSNLWSRWTSSISGLSGVTIDVAYFTLIGHTSPIGTPSGNTIYAEHAAAPAAPTSVGNYDGKTTTTASVGWDPTGVSAGSSEQSPSIVSIIQELSDSYDPSAIQVLYKGSGGTGENYNSFRTIDNDAANAPALHIEYTSASVEKVPTFVKQNKRLLPINQLRI